MSIFKTACGLLACMLLAGACRHPVPNQSGVDTPDGSYPADIAAIFMNKCATAGCHNAASYQNAGNLRMDTWEALFQGSSSGAVVIPYSITNSPLLYFINTDSSQGPVLEPQMPLFKPALSPQEYAVVRNWIANGAPDKNGKLPFGTNAGSRQKIYISEQGCDLIASVDAQSFQVMRQINIGKTPAIESAHCVRFGPDGKYAYVGFLAGSWIQKIDAGTDEVIDGVQVGMGQWNILHPSADGKELIAADFVNGLLKIIRTEDMAIIQTINGNGLFKSPHGIASNLAFDTFYVTGQSGNTVYKISRDEEYYEEVSIDNAPANSNPGTRDPHEILMSPDHSKYFVTCQASNEVRVMDAHSNQLLAAIPVGTFPQELTLSRTRPYVFASCMEDKVIPFYKGSVYAINYNTLQVEKVIAGEFYQPHGVTVDDVNGLLFIASANVDTSGVAPHHVSDCAGRNGWFSVYDLNTLAPKTTRRYEVTVYPYSIDTRFKP